MVIKKFMHITKELVEHLAKLALLELTEEEVTRYTRELDSLIGYFEKLNELNTTHIEPTYQVVPEAIVFREDSVQESFKREEWLKVVPQQEEGAIKVPKIIDVG